MKKYLYILILAISAIACSPSKKPVATKPKPTITKNDRFLGGTSFSDALVLRVTDERSVLNEEYKWLSISYPGYGLTSRVHVERSARHYDILRIKTSQKAIKDVYFDVTMFRRK